MVAPANVMINHRPIIFGEVLYDHFPDGSVVLGGAPFNVAWHLQAFGLLPLMISRIGNDPLGRQVRDKMLAWGMDCSGMQLDSRHPTGTVEVSFKRDEPYFDIVAERAYDFIDAEQFPPLPDNGTIYHGSLALRQKTSRNALQKLKQLVSAYSFVDINLRPPWYSESLIEEILRGATWLKLNDQELDKITSKKANLDEWINYLLNKLTLQYLIITQGSKGAIVVTAAGEKYHVDTKAGITVIDTVGAGDAFSSVMLLGQIKNWPIPVTLERAQHFAGAVVGVRGATIDDRNFYQPFIEDWELY